MAEPTKRKTWSVVKVQLEALDRKGLVSLLGGLNDANVANRRFLHSRLTPDSRAIEEYRRPGADAEDPRAGPKPPGTSLCNTPANSSRAASPQPPCRASASRRG